MGKADEMITCKHKGDPKYASICLGEFPKSFTRDGALNIRCPPCRIARRKEEQEKNKRNYKKNVKNAKLSVIDDIESDDSQDTRQQSRTCIGTYEIKIFKIENDGSAK